MNHRSHRLAFFAFTLAIAAPLFACASATENTVAETAAADSVDIRFVAVEEPSGAIRAAALDATNVERAWFRWTPDDGGVAHWSVAGVRYRDASSNVVAIPRMSRDVAARMLKATYEREAPKAGDVPYTSCGVYVGCADFEIREWGLMCRACSAIGPDCSTALDWSCADHFTP